MSCSWSGARRLLDWSVAGPRVRGDRGLIRAAPERLLPECFVPGLLVAAPGLFLAVCFSFGVFQECIQSDMAASGCSWGGPAVLLGRSWLLLAAPGCSPRDLCRCFCLVVSCPPAPSLLRCCLATYSLVLSLL